MKRKFDHQILLLRGDGVRFYDFTHGNMPSDFEVAP
jgi:hypothetical protein